MQNGNGKINIRSIKGGKRTNHQGRRVGSNLLVHDCSSFRLGAASACELDEVKRVNEKGFCDRSVNQMG